MKNLSFTTSTKLLTCALALGAFASSAQAFAQHTVKVEVPFAFQSDNKAMPAGTYRIDMPSTHLMLINGGTSASTRFAITEPDERAKTLNVSKVVFRRYGDRYFLHEVWLAGETTGHQCITTKAEKQLQVAKNPELPTGTEVALNVLPQ
jgi:hypothetical protein